VVIGAEPGLRQLAFQRVDEWVPPRWPDPAYPQQLHLDIRVSDADQAEVELLALGATRSHGRETGFRVFTDREMVMAVPTASSFDFETEQCMQRIVHAPDSVTDVVEDVRAAIEPGSSGGGIHSRRRLVAVSRN
jgi:Glyoxalase-like domain